MLKTKKQVALEIIGVIALIAAIVAVIIAVCSVTVPAKAEELISFPSYWEGTPYYMADLASIYAESDYEDLIYIARGGRSSITTVCLFRDGLLIATKDWHKRDNLPLGVFTLGELSDECGIFLDDFMYWLYHNESKNVTLVIDDRAYQPYNAPGYEWLFEDTDYADWD